MYQVINVLAEADRQLDGISVSRGDVFAMCNARRLLKTACDLLQKEVKRDESAVLDSGGDSGDRS